MAAPSAPSAMWAAPTSRGSVPKRFVRVTRTCDPPMLVRTTCRIVWFRTRTGVRGAGVGTSSACTSGGGGSMARGPVAQVPTHRPCAAETAGTARRTAAKAATTGASARVRAARNAGATTNRGMEIMRIIILSTSLRRQPGSPSRTDVTYQGLSSRVLLYRDVAGQA